MQIPDILAETDGLSPEPEQALPEPGPASPKPAFNVGRFLLRALWDVVSTVVPAIAIALLINIFVAQAMVVQGPSMLPTLHYDQRVMVEKVTYRVLGPRRGDVVIIEVQGEAEPLIKRVVALSGETVEVRDGQVFINGELLEESWTTQRGGPNYEATLIPPLHVFVLGDNRGSSRDSRSFGPVALDHLVGRAWLIYWPLDQAELIDG
jgi:signal peptidase I